MLCKFLLRGFQELSRARTLVFLGLALLSGNCVSKNSTEPVSCTIEDPMKSKSLEGTKKWQDEFIERSKTLCESSEFKEAWALFDQGGFTGKGELGQIMLISEHAKTKLIHVPVRGEKTEKELASNDPRLLKFMAHVKSLKASFKDHWEEGFDMIEREYLHIEKIEHKIQVKRVKWRFGRAKCEEHCELSKAFESLIK